MLITCCLSKSIKTRNMNEFAIHDATREGHLCRVRQLIEAGVPVDRLDEEGLTPLHLAALHGRYEVAALLVNSKCDLDIKDNRGRTPVILAAEGGRMVIVDLLLHHGPLEVNCVDDCGRTLLHHATSKDWTGIVRRIVAHGEADLNAADLKGRTPLMCAATREKEEVAAVLIQAGADVNRRDRTNYTALHFAALCGRTRVIQLLLEKEGLDLSPQNIYGDTPLHVACHLKTGFVPTGAIKQLLDACTDTYVKNNLGETALSVGIRRDNLTLEEIRLFVQKGAFLDNCDYECLSLSANQHLLKEYVLKDVELCTQSVVNKFNRQSLPALSGIARFARRLPNVDNFELGARQIDEVENLVKCEIERNTFCNVVKVRPVALSALCVLSLITCHSGKKRAASTGFGHSPLKKNRN